MRQVERATRDERRATVGEDVAETDGEGRYRLIRTHRRRGPPVAEDRQLVAGPPDRQRPRVLRLLVVRLSPRQMPGARDPGSRADVRLDGQVHDAVAE